MCTMQNLQYTLFIIYIRCKIRKLLLNNNGNDKIKDLIRKINNVINDNTPQKIFKLEKRMLK